MDGINFIYRGEKDIGKEYLFWTPITDDDGYMLTGKITKNNMIHLSLDQLNVNGSRPVSTGNFLLKKNKNYFMYSDENQSVHVVPIKESTYSLKSTVKKFFNNVCFK